MINKSMSFHVIVKRVKLEYRDPSRSPDDGVIRMWFGSADTPHEAMSILSEKKALIFRELSEEPGSLFHTMKMVWATTTTYQW